MNGVGNGYARSGLTIPQSRKILLEAIAVGPRDPAPSAFRAPCPALRHVVDEEAVQGGSPRLQRERRRDREADRDRDGDRDRQPGI